MDVSGDTVVLDLNEYENDTTVIDLNDGTRRVNAYGKPNSRLGERYDLIPDSDASINDEGLIRLALPCVRYIVSVKTCACSTSPCRGCSECELLVSRSPCTSSRCLL